MCNNVPNLVQIYFYIMVSCHYMTRRLEIRLQFFLRNLFLQVPELPELPELPITRVTIATNHRTNPIRRYSTPHPHPVQRVLT